MVDAGISYGGYFSEIVEKASREGYTIHYYGLGSYNDQECSFVRLASQKQPAIILSAGFHGDEVAGPLTFVEHFKEIADYALQKDVGLCIYPCVNPSGFDRRTRYNAANESPNNDFLRYLLANGNLTDDLGELNEFLAFYWSSDRDLQIKLPLETRLLHEDLKRLPLSKISGIVDLHQDTFRQDVGSYAYIFNRKEEYLAIAQRVDKIVPLLRNTRISSGYNIRVDSQGSILTGDSVSNRGLLSDDAGFIYRHDGTLQDILYRLGAQYAVTVETTGETDITKAMQVNLLWVKGVIDLVAKQK
ncbi:succinylglutamate desuccinylase/aspartoacylase family protein [Candidatus Woesearchaeota archaeon]|nr:succinylglutamate desuccinylase/aspartoacylase family protein [Candidatus Woesearchaeota archaeon]